MKPYYEYFDEKEEQLITEESIANEIKRGISLGKCSELEEKTHELKEKFIKYKNEEFPDGYTFKISDYPEFTRVLNPAEILDAELPVIMKTAPGEYYVPSFKEITDLCLKLASSENPLNEFKMLELGKVYENTPPEEFLDDMKFYKEDYYSEEEYDIYHFVQGYMREKLFDILEDWIYPLADFYLEVLIECERIDKELNPKYVLTDETIEVDGHTLHRIMANKDFSDVKKGDLGGFVENEKNLHQDDNCWIYDNAMCYEGGRVFNNAVLRGNARVHGYAMAYENSSVSGNAEVSEKVKLEKGTRVTENIKVVGEKRMNVSLPFRGDALIWNMGSFIVLWNEITKVDYMFTFSNEMWSNEDFYGTAEDLIRMGYEISEEMGREFERMAKRGLKYKTDMMAREERNKNRTI